MRIYLTLILFSLHFPMLYCATCTWLGSTSTDWHTASNWDTGMVPTAADDVIINSGTHQASISVGNVGACNNLTRAGGFLSSFVINGLLKIHGNLTYNGGYFTGDVSFVGNGLQVIKGISPLTLSNITVANTQGLLLDGHNVKLFGNLSLQSNVYTNGRSLEVASISGYNPGIFVVTGDHLGNATNTGGLVLNIGAGNSGFYPVGPNASTYTPATVSNTTGPAEKFSVAVTDTSISTDAVKNTWTISEYTVGGNTISLTLQWEQANEGATFNRANSGIYKVNGSSIDFSGYTPQPGPAINVSGTTWAQTLVGITDFSDWNVHNATSVLPITLLYFQVFRSAPKRAGVEWRIDLYSNTACFEVEKSRDGLNFRSVQKILPREVNIYQVDFELDPVLYYYRLKMLDTEGNITYSKILALDGYSNQPDILYINPNPCVQCTHIEFNTSSEGKLQLRLLNTEGKYLLGSPMNLDKNQSKFTLPVPTLPAGLYFITATNEQGKTSLHKLILQ